MKLFGLASILSGVASAASGQAVDTVAEQEPIIVTAPGDALERDEAVGVSYEDIRGSGKPDLLGALARSIVGLSLQDAQNNPFQPNVLYRGFTTSPLQGQAQGLAVYVDGARFNQPFGDTVQFDVLPEAAIRRVDLLDASPIYGLNALGGAIVVETKTGQSAPGVFASAAAGRFGERELTAEAGWSDSRASAYLALQRSHDGGWRRFSPSRLNNGFADFGWETAQGGAHLKLIGAATDLTGNGSAPVELLEADYKAVFTHPDNSQNLFGRASLHPWVRIGDSSRLEGTIYHQQLRQRTLNGDAADIQPCDQIPGLLCLETGDEEAPLRDQSGEQVPDLIGRNPYGVLNRSQTRTRASGILAQLVDRRPFAGGENVFIIGMSHDRSRTRFDSGSELGRLTDGRSVEGLGTTIAQPDGAITPVSLTARTRYTGFFISDQLPITSTVTAEIGLRWNEAAIELRDRIGSALDGNHRFRRLNPGMELEWHPAPNLTLRAGYSEANRVPTPAELACADEEAPCSLTNFFVADPPLQQVVAKSLELGGQGRIGPLEWLVTSYRSTNKDDIQFVASGVRGRAFFRNVGRTRRQGVEVTLGYRRGPLTLRAGYALTDATFLTPLLLNAPDNPASDENGQIRVQPGSRLPGVPRHRALLLIDIERQEWSVGADVQAASGQFLSGDEANLQPGTDPYVITNVRGSLRLSGPIHLFTEIRNLFDRRYATFGAFTQTDEIDLVEAPGASDPRSLGPAVPRRWLIGLKAAF